MLIVILLVRKLTSWSMSGYPNHWQGTPWIFSCTSLPRVSTQDTRIQPQNTRAKNNLDLRYAFSGILVRYPAPIPGNCIYSTSRFSPEKKTRLERDSQKGPESARWMPVGPERMMTIMKPQPTRKVARSTIFPGDDQDWRYRRLLRNVDRIVTRLDCFTEGFSE